MAARLKEILSRTRQTDATRDATARQVVSHVAPPRECDTRQSAETGRIPRDLEAGIRRMAEWWGYAPDELADALARAALRPADLFAFVAGDELWRAEHPDRRPTLH